MCSEFQLSNFCYYFGDGLEGPRSEAGLEKYDAEHKSGGGVGGSVSGATAGAASYAALSGGAVAAATGTSATNRANSNAKKSIIKPVHVQIFLGSASMILVLGGLVFVGGFM
jgi:hypothetical protein